MEVRNAISVALADGIYLRLDAANDPMTGNLETLHIGFGLNRTPTATHMMIGSETFSGTGTRVGIGCFPNFTPTGWAVNNIISLQGNVWFGGAFWLAGSSVRALDFFPAPATNPAGSANVDLTGIATGGLLNVGARTVTAGLVTGIVVLPVGAIFGGGGATTFSAVRGLFINTAVGPTLPGAWGRVTGIQVDPQPTGVNITVSQGIWLSGDGVGADLCFGAGVGNVADAHIYYDGADLVIDPQLLGAGGVMIRNMKSGATAALAGAGVDELWFTVGHAVNPDRTVMIG